MGKPLWQTIKSTTIKYVLLIIICIKICYWIAKKWIICSKGICSRAWIDILNRHLIDTQSTCWFTLDWHLINILVKLWSRVPQTRHHSTVYQYMYIWIGCILIDTQSSELGAKGGSVNLMLTKYMYGIDQDGDWDTAVSINCWLKVDWQYILIDTWPWYL